MSMADDNRLRSYRTNDPYGRAAEPAQPSEEASIRDPLAELAPVSYTHLTLPTIYSV